MFARLKGLVEEISTDHIILDVQGVGYKIFASRSTLSHLPEIGHATKLHIETQVRPESIQLFGFHDLKEKELFHLLTTVQGVGSRIALAVLSVLSPEHLLHALAAQDHIPLTQADGVGPKLALRITRELKDKTPKLGAHSLGVTLVQEDDIHDALSALMNLGYKRPEALAALEEIRTKTGATPPLDQWITQALKQLGVKS